MALKAGTLAAVGVVVIGGALILGAELMSGPPAKVDLAAHKDAPRRHAAAAPAPMTQPPLTASQRGLPSTPAAEIRAGKSLAEAAAKQPKVKSPVAKGPPASPNAAPPRPAPRTPLEFSLQDIRDASGKRVANITASQQAIEAIARRDEAGQRELLEAFNKEDHPSAMSVLSRALAKHATGQVRTELIRSMGSHEPESRRMASVNALGTGAQSKADALAIVAALEADKTSAGFRRTAVYLLGAMLNSAKFPEIAPAINRVIRNARDKDSNQGVKRTAKDALSGRLYRPRMPGRRRRSGR